MPSTLTVLSTAAAVGAGTVGGVFYAFSSFVMPALRRLPPAQGVAAMQQINITAVRPGLMIALFGTAAVCVATAVPALVRGVDRRSVLIVLGAACYLIGGVGVTVAVNVPLNDALAGLTPDADGSAARWAEYLQRWGIGNHVRTALCLAGSILLAASLAAGSDT